MNCCVKGEKKCKTGKEIITQGISGALDCMPWEKLILLNNTVFIRKKIILILIGNNCSAFQRGQEKIYDDFYSQKNKYFHTSAGMQSIKIMFHIDSRFFLKGKEKLVADKLKRKESIMSMQIYFRFCVKGLRFFNSKNRSGLQEWYGKKKTLEV